VSNLQPAPRHIPRSRIWLKSDTTRANLARTDITGLALIVPRFWLACSVKLFRVFNQLVDSAPGAQTFGLTVADSVIPKDCAPPNEPDSGKFRPASLRSVARSTTTLHPQLIRLPAAPFRSRNSPETGPDPAPTPKTFEAGHRFSKSVCQPNDTDTFFALKKLNFAWTAFVLPVWL
jgi:hypothetical protein